MTYSVPTSRYNFHFALYAPYKCRYHLYDVEEGRKCIIDQGVNKVVFYGSSEPCKEL